MTSSAEWMTGMFPLDREARHEATDEVGSVRQAVRQLVRVATVFSPADATDTAHRVAEVNPTETGSHRRKGGHPMTDERGCSTMDLPAAQGPEEMTPPAPAPTDAAAADTATPAAADTARVRGDTPTEWLQAEVPGWRSDGLVSRDQEVAILARYGLTDAPTIDRTGPGRLITAISAIGAILLGVGAILFFAANWSAMGQWEKVALVFAAIVLAYFCGYVLRYTPGRFPRVGDSVILLGALLFGAGVFLIEQIFHANAGDPIGVLLWAVGVLPLAYAVGNRGPLGLGLLALLLWFGWHAVVGSFGRGLEAWAAFLGIGVVYAALGYHHRRLEAFDRFEGLYRGLGLTVTFVALHVLTYRLAWDALPRIGERSWREASASGLSPIVVLLVMAIIAAVSVPWGLASRRRTLPFEALGLASVAALGLLTTVSNSDDVAVPILFNVVYFAAVLGIVAVGYLNAEPYSVNIGLFFFAIGLIARYFDFFWDLMPRSLFFMAGGVVLLIGSLALERFRRRLIADIAAA